MKKNALTRLKRLSTALIAVILLNLFLLLLLAGLKTNSTPERQNTNTPAPNNINISSENVSDSPPDSAWNDSQNFDKKDSNSLSGSGQSQNPAGEDAAFPSTPDADDPQTISETSTDTVTLCLMGDLMCLAGQQYTAERSDGTHDYTDSFYLMRDTFSACDFVIGNLETTLSESNPYSTKEREVNEQPNCNAPADYLASLTWAGVTHVVTANNHSLDGGLTGVEETIAHLDEYGIPHTGTYRTDYNGAHYMMLEKNGIRIAVLAFTELINQRALVTPEELSRIIDSYSRTDAHKRIADARAAGADFVIVYEHWGSENVHEVRDYQRSHAKELAEAGADLIIGSHPHCLQEAETIVTEDGRSVPCFYSLGNVVSSMTRDINHDTVFVKVTLQRTAENSVSLSVSEPPDTATGSKNPGSEDTTSASEADAVSIASITLLPCHVLTAYDGHYRVITPVDYEMDDEKATAELDAAKMRIEEIIKQ